MSPRFKHEWAYPVKIGDVLQNRYEIITKVGYGGCSTVWLARDLNRCVLPLESINKLSLDPGIAGDGRISDTPV